jgi:uncharacterized membrane protein
MRTVLRLITLGGGVVLVAGGLFGVIAYIAGVIDIFISQPADRSWLFWGLGLAVIGTAMIGAGVGLLVFWRQTRPEGR